MKAKAMAMAMAMAMEIHGGVRQQGLLPGNSMDSVVKLFMA